MKKLLAVTFLSLLSVRASAGADETWREALSRELVDPAAQARWAKMAEDGRHGRVKATEDEILRWDFIDDEQALTMTMSRKAFDRYSELYRRWQEDPSLRVKYKDNSTAYLGSVGARDAAAVIDAIVTPLNGGTHLETFPLSHAILDFLTGTMKVAERIDSGQFDLFGSDVGDFFKDRSRGAGIPTLQRTTRRMRVRVRPRADVNASKVALVYSANPSYELLRDGRFELGVEFVPLKGAEITRGWVGVTRPWPER